MDSAKPMERPIQAAPPTKCFELVCGVKWNCSVADCCTLPVCRIEAQFSVIHGLKPEILLEEKTAIRMVYTVGATMQRFTTSSVVFDSPLGSAFQQRTGILAAYDSSR